MFGVERKRNGFEKEKHILKLETRPNALKCFMVKKNMNNSNKIFLQNNISVDQLSRVRCDIIPFNLVWY